MAGATGETTADGRLRRLVRRNERALIVVWLAGCAALLAFVGVWGIALNGAERAVERLDARWIDELGDIETALREGRFEACAARLERLDRDCPASFAKHRYDKQRERLLGALGECYVELGKHKQAVATLERLVSFDPRNFDNHFRLAEAQRAFGDTQPARAAYEAVLALHPTHLPSVTAVIDMAYDAGRHADVVESYEHYLDAWLLAPVRLRCGEQALALEARVDGEAHTLEGLLALPPGWSGNVELETNGYSARVEWLEFVPPLRVGVAEVATPVLVAPVAQWSATDGTSPAVGELSAATSASKLRSTPVTLTHGATRVRAHLALYKALEADLWAEVTQSYRNRLELQRGSDATRRSRVGGCPAGGTVFED